MKHIAYLILLTLVCVSCGTDSHHFKLDGQLLHMNQGEFYVYSPDGIIDGLDTIKVQGGRFTYEIPCEKEGILSIVFPNFSEQPVFAQPGKSVDVKGDASRLKELQVDGTKENETMSKFRKKISNASPPEILKYVEEYVHDNPQLIGAQYLVMKYFLKTPKTRLRQGKAVGRCHGETPSQQCFADKITKTVVCWSCCTRWYIAFFHNHRSKREYHYLFCS